ncbi:unnamed protein product [Linum tenue]|uniref:Uncharacterized protein n=1 Tax=Linum tenue TaxID=586396 RepID=A0AAV0QQA3_9ROSI|nr:unnamed protein product [Linum tenue]
MMVTFASSLMQNFVCYVLVRFPSSALSKLVPESQKLVSLQTSRVVIAFQASLCLKLWNANGASVILFCAAHGDGALESGFSLGVVSPLSCLLSLVLDGSLISLSIDLF